MQIDARGLSCPQPVVLVNKAIKDGQPEFEVIVNSETSKENVIRILTKGNYKAEVVKEDGDDLYIKATK